MHTEGQQYYQPPQSQRPISVGVIGWMWIIFGAFGVFQSSIMFAMGQFITSMISHSDQPPPPEGFTDLFRFLPVLGFFELVISGVGIYAAIRFLKLDPRGRTILEVLCWISIVAGVCISALWGVFFMNIANPELPADFGLTAAVISIANSFVWAVPFAIMIYFLRTPKVREAMKAPESKLFTADLS